jgi:hypothetical protein
MLKPAPTLDPLTGRFLGAVRYWAMQRGLKSKRAVSKAIKKSDNYIDLLVKGKQPLPSMDSIEFIVSKGIHPNWLFLGCAPALLNQSHPDELAALPEVEAFVQTPSGRLKPVPFWHFDWATGTASPALTTAA